MKKDLDRIVKGYRPKSDRGSYWFLYYLLRLVVVVKTKFVEKLKS
jgi:hypothetical protein